MTEVDRTAVAGPAADALAALAECARVSTACAATMIDAGGMAHEALVALDCADQCGATERVLARHASLDDDVVTAAVDAAITAATASASACGAHADHHEHCARHSRAATACADALTALRKG